nr:uncharacterized protein LOC109159904 [Ipomoea batatas]
MAKRGLSGPMMIAGDFNYVITQDETSNYYAFSAQRSSEFADWMNSEGLIDMGFSGPKLTWVRGTHVGLAKGARLDRALCNVPWQIRFPGASVMHLPRISSDHTPILIRTDANVQGRTGAAFRFQAAWLTDRRLADVVRNSWGHHQLLQQVGLLQYWPSIHLYSSSISISCSWETKSAYGVAAGSGGGWAGAAAGSGSWAVAGSAGGGWAGRRGPCGEAVAVRGAVGEGRATLTELRPKYACPSISPNIQFLTFLWLTKLMAQESRRGIVSLNLLEIVKKSIENIIEYQYSRFPKNARIYRNVDGIALELRPDESYIKDNKSSYEFEIAEISAHPRNEK